MKKSMNVLGLIAVLVIVGLVFSGICLAAELTDSLTQASAQNELNTVTSFTADDNLNVRITNVDATKFQAYFAYKSKTSMNPIASGLVNAGATRNINSIFIMAVAAWESGWGTSNYAAARHNYFGYGALYSNPDNAWAFNSADECVDVVASRIKADYLLDVSYGTYTVLTPTGQIYNPDTSQYHNGPPYTEEVRTTGAHYNEATLRGWIVDWNLNSQSELSGVLSIMNDFVSWHVQTYGVGVEINDSAIPVSNGFDYPVGDTGYVTEANDGDGWYNAQDFGVNNHLGEDWNGESGGDTDCGKPVYAVSKGTIVYVEDAGSGWGNVIIVRHPLPDGTQVESLYGHLQSMSKTSGTVERREQIGTIGKDGWPSCHLHFELRLSNCRAWGSPGPGYSTDACGWTDSSDFIDSHRQLGIIPLTADLNGNGTDTTGSYNISTAEFTFDGKTVRFGMRTDLPVTGDWDGDGYDELGIYRPKVEGFEQSTFYLVTRNWADLLYEVGAADKTIPFGYYPNDIPLAGDWDGDGDDDIGGYCPVNSTFCLYLLNRDSSTATSFKDVPFGLSGDSPITGDWDLDGDDDVGVFRSNEPPNTNCFCLDLGLTGGQHELGPYELGNISDKPIAGDWDGDGCDNIGVFRPSENKFYLRDDLPTTPVIYVPDDYPTIQAAINAASNGDTIVVYSGTYTENIVLKAGITLQGVNPRTTKINGVRSGNVVVGADNSVIDGFTITGSGNNWPSQASGVYCYDTSPKISNNIIISNYYGICCKKTSSAHITNILIINWKGSIHRSPFHLTNKGSIHRSVF